MGTRIPLLQGMAFDAALPCLELSQKISPKFDWPITKKKLKLWKLPTIDDSMEI
jgi:hypothetical protein